MLTLDREFTRGVAEDSRVVVVPTARGLRLHPVKVVIEPRGWCVGDGCAGRKKDEKITSRRRNTFTTFSLAEK